MDTIEFNNDVIVNWNIFLRQYAIERSITKWSLSDAYIPNGCKKNKSTTNDKFYKIRDLEVVVFFRTVVEVRRNFWPLILKEVEHMHHCRTATGEQNRSS